jgi:hypothetical protein
VTTKPVNLYLSARRIIVFVNYQSEVTYICINLIPFWLVSLTSPNDLLERELRHIIMFLSFAIFAGMVSPSGWHITFMAHGANPKGNLSTRPNIFVYRSGTLVLFRILGMIMSL